MFSIYKFSLLIILISLLSCKQEKHVIEAVSQDLPETQDIIVTKKQFEASEMKIGKLNEQAFYEQIEATGKIHLPIKDRSIVSTILSGRVSAFNLKEGQWIKKGQLLFTVSNPELIDLQEEYLSLKTKLSYLKEELKRKQDLVSENLTAKKEFLKSKSDFDYSETKFKVLKERLKYFGLSIENINSENLKTHLSVYAPTSGYLSKINVVRGSFLDPHIDAMVIDNVSMVQLRLNLLERYKSNINKDQVVMFKVEGESNKDYKAKVSLISPTINDNGMITVDCSIDDIHSNLLPGMYTTAKIVLNGFRANAINQDAIVQIDGQPHLLVLKSEKNGAYNFIPYSVELGLSVNDFVEIKNNEEIGRNKILVKGGYYLVE